MRTMPSHLVALLHESAADLSHRKRTSRPSALAQMVPVRFASHDLHQNPLQFVVALIPR
jgi:hypothetical protein